MPPRSVQHRPADARQYPSAAEILIAGTSNMTFQAVAAAQMPDLAAIKGSHQRRMIPRTRLSSTLIGMFSHIDEDTPLWRYMDFDKLVTNLFPSSAIFTSLQTMADHTEGQWYRYIEATEPSIYREVRQRTYIMCWTLNDPSTNRAWSEYTTPRKGVALKTTFGKLRQEYHGNGAGPIQTYVSKVHYTENPFAVAPSFDMATVARDIIKIATTKSSSFQWENEVRVIAVQTTEAEDPWKFVLGTIDIDDLVDDVSVCPDAEPWLDTALQQVLKFRTKAPNHCYAAIYS